jgi:hypothetical protein
MARDEEDAGKRAGDDGAASLRMRHIGYLHDAELWMLKAWFGTAGVSMLIG